MSQSLGSIRFLPSTSGFHFPNAFAKARWPSQAMKAAIAPTPIKVGRLPAKTPPTNAAKPQRIAKKKHRSARTK